MLRHSGCMYLKPALRLLAAIIVVVSAIIAVETASFANGYEENPPRIAWSPAGNVLVGVVNDELWIVDVLGYADILESGGVSSPTFSQDGLYLAFIQNGELKVYDWMLSEYVETAVGASRKPNWTPTWRVLWND